MTKILKKLNVFSREFRARQDVSDETQTIISIFTYELQNSIEKVGPQTIEKDLEELENAERYQIENPTKYNMRKI